MYCQFINQVKALKYKADVAFTELCPLALRVVGNLMVHKMILTARGIVQQAHDIEQGRLATTRRAHDGYKFASFDFQIYIIECGSFYFV